MKARLEYLLPIVFLFGCAPRVEKPVRLYEDATGKTAKLRVVGFTDFTRIRQIISCTEDHNFGYLRDMNHEERNPPRVLDKGFTKTLLRTKNTPLDYQERLIPATGWIIVESALFTSDDKICSIDTRWFKPEENALYEVTNRLNKEGTHCIMKLAQIDQQTGKEKLVKTNTYVAEFLPCKTINSPQD